MKASFENHDKVVQLLVAAGATLDLLHQVHNINSVMKTILGADLGGGGE